MRKSNFFKESLFKPSVIRNRGAGTPQSLSDTFQDSFGTMFGTASFRFDPAGSPLKSTQQLNIDFSKFENHTFFNSAKNKVHLAFEKIINQYPFDGTRQEYEAFFNKISGFEKYVFDLFPKSTGFLIFDRVGTSPGNFLSVKDYKGSGEQLSIREYDGKTLLNIDEKPFSMELNLFIPSGTQNYNEVIAQRVVSGNQGYTLAVSDSSGLSSPNGMCDIFFSVSDEEKSAKVVHRIEKGKFNHIAAIYERGTSDKLKLVINGLEKSFSSGTVQVNDINFVGSRFLVGSGSNHALDNTSFEPKQTLSGAMDDFRFFNSARSDNDIKKYKDREIFSQPDLQLYFRFNEPSGSYSLSGVGNNNLCLDHSGNAMHTFVENFDIKQRDHTRLTADSLVEEDKNISPVLFPSFETVQSLATNLISSASNYDYNNPNIITKLVPKHYLEDEITDLREFPESSLEKNPHLLSDAPGGNKIRQSQLIASVLYMWAESFDETKMFIDEIARLLKVDYLDDRTISDQLLPFLAKYHSFNLPSQFNQATAEQYLQGRNVTFESAQANRSLQDIQNIIWRRILSDLPELRRTKGTRSSIEALLRNTGINPGTTFRIKEYGGSRTKEIQNSYEKRTQILKMIDFSGSFSSQGSIDGEGRDSARPLITSPFLTGSRFEPGHPKIKGSFAGISLGVSSSNNESDGLFTSSSWTYEGLYKFPGTVTHPRVQSLARIQTTGSSGGSSNTWLTYNLLAIRPTLETSKTGSIVLIGKPSGNHADTVRVEVSDVNIFDGQKWYVSFGRNHGSHMSSSYFLRVGKPRYTKESLFYTASSNIFDASDNTLNTKNSAYNASGSFIAVGSMSLGYDGTSPLSFLNQSSLDNAREVNFTGRVSNVRFFTKALSGSESIAHTENPKSLGVKDPTKNFNFVTQKSGSFEKLRINYEMNQQTTMSNGGGLIDIFDFAQNEFHARGTGFEPSGSMIKPERHDFRTILPKLDTRSEENKVRIRSYLSLEKAEKHRARVAPLYELPPEEKPEDDRRVAVEVSSVQALNDDIILLFSTLDFFDNALGDPELVFASEYKSLREMRRIYFNRITDKMSLMKFFSFFRWFDDTVGDILEDLMPRTSRYLGTNFVIESHSLERPKFRYNYSDMYLGELERPDPGKIFVQQLVGILKKR